ncbi:ricin B-like lectin EULS3 [Lolium perenne]|uniref:ricin B-like lectin EULS3 n=1 Tax=Lolium perenne TaxID=4522 RepID=UPI0021F5A97E|nr:ricin B-like lectin R40G3 [Lolium perenne]
MEFPHRHGHGHGRRDDDDSDDRRAPAHGYGAPAPAYGRDDDEYGRHAPAPAYGAPAPAYGRDDDYGRHAPAPAYGGGRDDGYGRHEPAPAYGGGGGYGAPSPAAYGGGRDDGYGRHAPAPAAYGGGGGGGYGAPAHGNVVHVSHESGHDERPHYGGYGNETRPHQGAGGGGAAVTTAEKTYRILCKAGEDGFSLGTRGDKVCFLRTDQDDHAQHWIKDMKYSTRVKDEEGYPAFALVNKATREALKHSLGQSHPVLLTRYNANSLDESVLWTESRDVGNGYRCIRMVNNIYLNFDALNGDPNQDNGGVREGTTLILWEWTEGDNQRWKIVEW